MRVLVAPDSFGGTLTAAEAAAAIATGWPARDEVDRAPLSDGGPGFLAVLSGERRELRVTGPLGAPVLAQWLLDGETAYLEAAQACGLHLVAGHPDAEGATSRGVGELAAAAVEAGARTLVIGLGGTASTDGGRGFLQAYARTDRTLVAASDVDNPLLGPHGAAATFGPQKGADRAAVARLEQRLTVWADGRPEAALPGAGAAGGLGFALLTLGAQRVSGAALAGDRVGLPARVAAADLVLTGEGAYDATSLRGKVTAYVAALAMEQGLPCVVLAGRVAVGRREAAAHGVTETWDLTEHAGGAALTAPAASLSALARRVAGQWSPA